MNRADEAQSRRNINVVSGAAMVGGAALAVVVGVLDKAGSPAMSTGGTTTISFWEVLLYMALGAMPGWVLKGLLLRRFHPDTELAAAPRCKHCGAPLARSGERCPDCRGA